MSQDPTLELLLGVIETMAGFTIVLGFTVLMVRLCLGPHVPKDEDEDE